MLRGYNGFRRLLKVPVALLEASVMAVVLTPKGLKGQFSIAQRVKCPSICNLFYNRVIGPCGPGGHWLPLPIGNLGSIPKLKSHPVGGSST